MSFFKNVRHALSAYMHNDFGDTLHNVSVDFGYPRDLTFEKFYLMYDRFGIAQNVVESYPEAGWLEPPQIESKNKLFLSAFDALDKKFNFWHTLKTLDVRQRVGRYAGLFMRIRDDQQPHLPIKVSSFNSTELLVDMLPLYESQLDVISTNQDILADDYSKPTMYQYQSADVGNLNIDAKASYNVHPSRVIIASEDNVGTSIYGKSALRSVYNDLLNLMKIIGAGGEGFYRNACASVHLSLKDPASAKVNEDLLNELRDQWDDFLKNRMSRVMWTPGLDAQVLNSILADPKNHFTNALNSVASGAKIPINILIGMQTGRLASDEDGRSFLSRVQSRRVNYQDMLARKVIDWLIQYRILPVAEYDLIWSDALALSREEKLANAFKMSEINNKQFVSGGGLIFSDDEIRMQAGYDAND